MQMPAYPRGFSEQNWLQLARSYETAQLIVATGVNGRTVQ